MAFVIYFTFLLILVTSFSIGPEKVMCFSVFSPKHVNPPSGSPASFLLS